jgi:hypothetical protein
VWVHDGSLLANLLQFHALFLSKDKKENSTDEPTRFKRLYPDLIAPIIQCPEGVSYRNMSVYTLLVQAEHSREN